MNKLNPDEVLQRRVKKYQTKLVFEVTAPKYCPPYYIRIGLVDDDGEPYNELPYEVRDVTDEYYKLKKKVNS